MEFKQIYTPGIAHCSYAIGGKNECIIIDPSRDINKYINAADAFGLKITTILQTHLHADFVSGHIELAHKTGAKIYMSESANAEFDHYALKDDEELSIDTLKIKFMHTPGHTPESGIYIVSDLERGDEPVMAFTGDTLLVGDAGRPDLFVSIKERLASSLYESLRKIEQIGDNVEVYPAHGAGSLCGRALSSKLSSTIGTEKMQNEAMKLRPENKFVNTFLAQMPEAPDHFFRCSEINRKGPALITSLSRPKEYEPNEFLYLAQSGFSIADTRDMLSFASCHIPNSYALSLMGNLATFAGWILPRDKPILLILPSQKDTDSVLKALYRTGNDNIAGYLKGGMDAYMQSGLITSRLQSISASEVKEKHESGEITLVDTRLKGEWDSFHIKNSVHIPAPDVRSRYAEIDAGKPVAFICTTGVRSVLAASIFKNRTKRNDIYNVVGGTGAWVNAGFEILR